MVKLLKNWLYTNNQITTLYHLLSIGNTTYLIVMLFFKRYFKFWRKHVKI
jgi:hypothetical protein